MNIHNYMRELYCFAGIHPAGGTIAVYNPPPGAHACADYRSRDTQSGSPQVFCRGLTVHGETYRGGQDGEGLEQRI